VKCLSFSWKTHKAEWLILLSLLIFLGRFLLTPSHPPAIDVVKGKLTLDEALLSQELNALLPYLHQHPLTLITIADLDADCPSCLYEVEDWLQMGDGTPPFYPIFFLKEPLSEEIAAAFAETFHLNSDQIHRFIDSDAIASFHRLGALKVLLQNGQITHAAIGSGNLTLKDAIFKAIARLKITGHPAQPR
jgi:hypothetical protein